MSDCEIKRASCDGVGYSIATLQDVRRVFAAAVPCSGLTLREQTEDALRTIETINGVHGSQDSIVQQAVFLANDALIPESREIIRRFYGSNMPATSYIPQPPCNGRLIAIEALGICPKQTKIKIERISEQLVVAHHDDIASAYAAYVTPNPNLIDPYNYQQMLTSGSSLAAQRPQPTRAMGAYRQSLRAFQQLRDLLARAGMSMDQMVRAWHYQGGIVADEGVTQRYKELNRARTEIYKDVSFYHGRLPKDFPWTPYPAATGIGTEGRGFSISAIAISSDRDDIVIAPLENPRQTPAHKYPTKYSPDTPKFARGLAVSCGSYATIFISGTASVTDSEVRHIGDPAGQTHETLENITALISEENLANHGLPGMGTSLNSLGHVRVYIKYAEHYETIRAICKERLGELPTIFAIGDVCRPDWLVEIEGIALARRV